MVGNIRSAPDRVMSTRLERVGAQSDVDRHRKAIQGLQTKIAAESAKVATAREREARARQQASKASSATAATAKHREADRRGKEAIDAEKRRSQLEKQLADKQKLLHSAESKLDRERSEEQRSALSRLENRARESERQFYLTSDDPFEPEPALSSSTEEQGAMHDVFIAHASEDKEQVARPLAELLQEHALSVWYDEFTLTIGDNLRRSIDRGLASSRFGVVILSPDFFRKEWPQAELDGLVAKQRSSGTKVLLPIWHRLTKDDVLAQAPTLVELKALNTSVMTLDEIAAEIAAVVRPA